MALDKHWHIQTWHTIPNWFFSLGRGKCLKVAYVRKSTENPSWNPNKRPIHFSKSLNIMLHTEPSLEKSQSLHIFENLLKAPNLPPSLLLLLLYKKNTFWTRNIFHYSDIIGLCLMKWPSEMLQNLLLFLEYETPCSFFHFSMLLYFFP